MRNAVVGDCVQTGMTSNCGEFSMIERGIVDPMTRLRPF